ncbi:hypothetical protein PoB_002828300 [Plakobranchus ocellatus]|uniref:Uncharacterized protein n=1 Tax=Plakobranchus ocellatus TaxID=259542 RepID=A0AAV4A3K9_9GAST|nr:hypothetical protein PoB_002828300 [Plakobranchus ocellatus]
MPVSRLAQDKDDYLRIIWDVTIWYHGRGCCACYKFISTECRNVIGALFFRILYRGVGGTVANESTLRSAVTLLWRVRAPPPEPWPDGGPESLRSF